jgi:hypothetical protein
MMVLKEHIFLVPVFSWVIVDSPPTDKYEVDWRNCDLLALGFQESITRSGLQCSATGSRLKLDENTETSEVVEGLKGNMPVHSNPLTALPTVFHLFRAPEKKLPE